MCGTSMIADAPKHRKDVALLSEDASEVPRAVSVTGAVGDLGCVLEATVRVWSAILTYKF